MGRVTNEERREIASRLRAMPEDSDDYDLSCALTGRKIWPLNHEQMGEFIADLIDPDQERTCKFVPSGEVDEVRYEQCSHCGADYELKVVRAFFNYCPNCGARIVHDTKDHVK